MKYNLVLAFTLFTIFCIATASADVSCSFINITQGLPGANGTNGINGTSCTLNINWTFTGAPGTSALVTNIGTTNDALLDFTIPQGLQGDAGTPGTNGTNGSPGSPGAPGANGANATVAINYTFTLLPGNPATVVNIGTPSDVLLDIGIPQGEAGSPGTPGTNGTNGINGTSASVAINNTITLAAGSPATVTNVGNETAVNLDFGIPKGDAGDAGDTSQFLFLNGSRAMTGDLNISGNSIRGSPGVNITLNDIYGGNFFNILNSDSEPVFSVDSEGLVYVHSTIDLSDAGTAGRILGLNTYNVGHSATNKSYVDSVNTSMKNYVDSRSTSDPAPDSNLSVMFNFNNVESGNASFTYNNETGIVTAPYFSGDGSGLTNIGATAATSLTFRVKEGGFGNLKKGQAVYISGGNGGLPYVTLADNTNTAKSRVVGLVAANINQNAEGNVRRGGTLTLVDTRSTNSDINPLGQTWAAGDLLFATTGGGLTNVRPTSGRSVKVAYSLSGSSATDTLLVYPLENPVWTTAASAEDIVLRMGDNAGANKVSFRNYSNSEVGYILSNGTSSFGGGSNYNASYLPRDGSLPMEGNLNLSSNFITGDSTGVAVELPDDAGNSFFAVLDSHDAFVSTINSDGLGLFKGGITSQSNINMSEKSIVSLVTGLTGDTATNKTYVDSVNTSMKNYVDALPPNSYNASYINKDGSVAMTGNLSLGTKNINNLATPSLSTDAATKAYVDALPIYNASYITSTYNATYDAKPSSTYNSTYDAKAPATSNAYITLMAGSSMYPTTNPATLGQFETATNKNNYIWGNFTDGGSENMQWLVDMPADWNSTDATNGKLTFYTLWTAQSGTGTVEWDYAGKLFPDDAPIDTALAAIGTSTDTLLTAGDMHVSPASTAAVVTSAGTGGQTMILKVTRNSAADTLNANAQLIGVRIKYIRTIAA